MVRPAEVEHTQVGHDAIDVDEPERRIAGIDFVVADPGYHVDGLAEHPRRVVAHPVARGVIDGVAGRAAHTEHLPLGLLQWPERRDVLIAVAVNLVGAHHHMPPPPRQCLEYTAKWHPTLDRAGSP